MPTSILITLISVVFAIFGLYRLFQAFTIYRKVYAAQTWPETPGRVTEARIKTRLLSNDHHHWAEFSYSYTVLGSEYRGKFKLDSFLGFQYIAARRIKELPVGTTFSVHYNPERPQECTNQYDKVSAYEWLITLFCLGPIVVWVGQLLHLWK